MNNRLLLFPFLPCCINVRCADEIIMKYVSVLFDLNLVTSQEQRGAKIIKIEIIDRKKNNGLVCSRGLLIHRTAKVSLYKYSEDNYKAVVCNEKIDSAESLYYHLFLPYIKIIACQFGYIDIHGSGIELSGCGIVFYGKSNAGKSTLATLLLLNGGFLLNDDILFIKERNVYSFYRPIHIFPDIANIIGIGSQVEGKPYIKNREEVNYYYQYEHSDKMKNFTRLCILVVIEYDDDVIFSAECENEQEKRHKIRHECRLQAPCYDDIRIYSLRWGSKMLRNPSVFLDFISAILKENG